MDLHLNLELTDHCNLRCRMCSQSLRDEAHGAPMRFMAWDTWRAALLGLADSDDDVHLCPHWLGEPTLHPRFDDFIEYAFAANRGNRLFRSFKLHTNGVLLSEERSRLLLRLARGRAQAPDTFRAVHFSVDAWSPATYARVKGADRREQVYGNIHRFLRVRGTSLRPAVTVAFVVQPDNHHEARAFRDHWVEALGTDVAQTVDWPPDGVDAVYFRPLNTSDQAAADALHARVCRDLGLTDDRRDRLRADGSF